MRQRVINLKTKRSFGVSGARRGYVRNQQLNYIRQRASSQSGPVLIYIVNSQVTHRSATTLKPLTGKVNYIDHLVQCSAGKPKGPRIHVGTTCHD